jgi:hypothetical protein
LFFSLGCLDYEALVSFDTLSEISNPQPDASETKLGGNLLVVVTGAAD